MQSREEGIDQDQVHNQVPQLTQDTIWESDKNKAYSKPCLKQPHKKKTKVGFQDRLLLNAGQKYCRMLPFKSKAYSKPCLKRPHKKNTKIGFQDRLSLNAGQKYYRMLQGKHSAILSTFIKLPFVIKIFV